MGGNGGGLGYYGIGNSIAIKFDYYNNAGEGDDSTGLYEDGAYPDIPAIDLSGTGVNISSGDPMDVTMNYDGSTLNVTISDVLTGASASQSYSVDIPSVVGSTQAYVGFTGGTGGLTSIPAILNWTYTPGQGAISTAASESINDFVAASSGWYYAAVGGEPATNYSLVVTRGADFDLHGSSFDKAQPLNGADVVLGGLIPPTAPLYTLDDNFCGSVTDLADRPQHRCVHRIADLHPDRRLNRSRPVRPESGLRRHRPLLQRRASSTATTRSTSSTRRPELSSTRSSRRAGSIR